MDEALLGLSQKVLVTGGRPGNTNGGFEKTCKSLEPEQIRKKSPPVVGQDPSWKSRPVWPVDWHSFSSKSGKIF
jgi:hypothetical protein